jgi:hypothetical protein
MTEREALKLALEALKQIDEAMPFPVAKLAIMEAEKALAQPEQIPPSVHSNTHQPEQEPVAFICQGNAYMADDVDEYCTATHIPLYTTPPQRTWVGLTHLERSELWEVSRAALPRYATYASLVEAKLKEKNT